MDTFTLILIVLGVALVIAVVVSQVRGRRRSHHISQNAPMDGNDNNVARYTSTTNIHNGGNGFTPGGGL